MKIKLDDLVPWTAVLRPDKNGYYIISQDGKIISECLGEADAMLCAAAPSMLRFLATFFFRENAPVRIDADHMLRRNNIELEV